MNSVGGKIDLGFENGMALRCAVRDGWDGSIWKRQEDFQEHNNLNRVILGEDVRKTYGGC